MRVVVLGARGGVGRHAVEVALGQGHEVVAGARGHTDASPVTRGAGTLVERMVDVRDADQVAAALEGADAVLWCVGVTKHSGGDVGRTSLPHVVAGADKHGVRRLVSVSGAGVTLAADDKGLGARLVSGLTARLAGDLVADKAGEHDVLVASDLVWTEVRPPRLVDRDGTGRWELSTTAPGLTARPVTKVDVARAMLALAEGEDWAGRSPFLLAGS